MPSLPLGNGSTGHPGDAGWPLGTGQTEDRSPWSAAERLSTGSSGSPLPPSAACTARRHPPPRRLPPAAPSSHLRDTRQVVQPLSAAKALAPGSAGAATWTPPALPGHSLPKPSRGAGKAAHDRTASCARTTTAAVALRTNSFGAQEVTQTTAFKLFPGDSLILVSKYCSSGFLVFCLHNSFHSYLLRSTLDLLFTVLLQKSLSQQLWIAVRETTSELLP